MASSPWGVAPIIRTWKKNSSIVRRPFARGSCNCGTLFDWDTKRARIQEIDDQMAGADFWNNQERAQAIVEERKSLTSVFNPLDAAIKSSDDLAALIDMSAEDESFAAEVPD